MTPRQLDVWPLLAEGKTNLAIARELNIAEKTVKAHVTALLRTLGVRSRTQAAALFYRPELRERLQQELSSTVGSSAPAPKAIES